MIRPLGPREFSHRVASFIRKIHCKGCGLKLQDYEANGPGFQPKYTSNATYAVASDQTKHYDALLAKMSPEQKQALNSGVGQVGHVASMSGPSDSEIRARERRRKKQERQDNFCRACLDTSQGRIAPVEPYSDSKSEILKQIPPSSTCFYVIDALDFPLSFDKEVPNSLGNNVHFVVNRADLVASHPNQVSRLKDYVMNEVFDPLNIPQSNVFITSALKGWGLKHLSTAFSNLNYFIGNTNCGKTALCTALCSHSPGSRTWPLPFTTQAFCEARTSPEYGSKTIVDSPSFPENTNGGKGIFGLLDKKYLRKVSAGAKMMASTGKYTSKPVVGKPGQVISVAGLVGLQLSEGVRGNAVHVWPTIGGYNPAHGRANNSMEKTKQLNASNDPVHGRWNMFDKTSDARKQPLEKKVSLTALPRAQNKSIVVRGLGAIHPSVFGHYDKPYEISGFAHKQVDLGTRSEMLPWLVIRKGTRVAREAIREEKKKLKEVVPTAV